jgi:hypothetical protein
VSMIFILTKPEKSAVLHGNSDPDL